jgi:hypothetical protein
MTLDEHLHAEPRLSDRRIAEALGIARHVVRHRRRVLGIRSETHPGVSPGVPAWETKIRALHAGGATVEAMVAGTGWSEGTIRNRLSSLGLADNRERE